MKFILLVIGISFFATLKLSGQNKVNLESITYSDGAVFKGNTLDEGDQTIKFILSSTGDTVDLIKPWIKKWIRSEEYLMYKGDRYHPKTGSFKSLNLSLGSNLSNSSIQGSFIFGKMLKPKLGVGGGIGINSNSADNITYELLPFGEVFLYGKYYLNNNRRRLFIDSKLGIGIPLGFNVSSDYSAGFLLQPGIGFEFATTKKARWSFKLSQFMQSTKIKPDLSSFGISDFSSNYKTVLNRTMFGVSLNF